jgi:hypothetical protein
LVEAAADGHPPPIAEEEETLQLKKTFLLKKRYRTRTRTLKQRKYQH